MNSLIKFLNLKHLLIIGLSLLAFPLTAQVLADDTPPTYVQPVPPQVLSQPNITGTVGVGDTITGNIGSWSSQSPITYTYQWERCPINGASCVDVAGATTTTYTIQASDVTYSFRFAVMGVSTTGVTRTVSDPTPTVTTAPVTIITTGGGGTTTGGGSNPSDGGSGSSSPPIQITIPITINLPPSDNPPVTSSHPKGGGKPTTKCRIDGDGDCDNDNNDGPSSFEHVVAVPYVLGFCGPNHTVACHHLTILVKYFFNGAEENLNFTLYKLLSHSQQKINSVTFASNYRITKYYYHSVLFSQKNGEYRIRMEIINHHGKVLATINHYVKLVHR